MGQVHSQMQEGFVFLHLVKIYWEHHQKDSTNHNVILILMEAFCNNSLSSQAPMIHSFIHLILIQGNFCTRTVSLKFWLDGSFTVCLHPLSLAWVCDIFILDNCPAFLPFIMSLYRFQSLIPFLCCAPHTILDKTKILFYLSASIHCWEMKSQLYFLGAECSSVVNWVSKQEQGMLPLFIIVIFIMSIYVIDYNYVFIIIFP